MTARILHFGAEARDKLLKGVILLADAVGETLGPRGRNVVIEKYFANPLITKDGVTVASEIELKDPVVNMGAQMVKEVAAKTCHVAGDGTTTATILARAIAVEGNKCVTAGMTPIDLKRGIDKAIQVAITALKKMAIPCVDSKNITQVATISANGDATIGKLIAEAMGRVTREGVITVEEGSGLTDELVVVEGMELDRGYVSPTFANNTKDMRCELDNPYVLIVDRKISAGRELMPLLEQLATSGAARPLFIIAEDVDNEALALLLLNTQKGIVKSCAIKSPGFGDKRKDILQDLAILTNTTIISQSGTTTLSAVKLAMLGTAQRVVVEKDKTTIISSDNSTIKENIKQRIEYLKAEVENIDHPYNKHLMKQRIGKLGAGVAIIRAGGVTETEMKERKARIEDALHATRAAVDEGILPGGGVAYIRILDELHNIETINHDENQGVQIILRALESPIRQIAANAGAEPAVVLGRVKAGTGNYGYNAATEEYGDMLELGILDPAKVACSALQNAASISGLIITTECSITNDPDEQQQMRPHHHLNLGEHM